MINKVKEIVNSWIISYKPSEYQKNLAEERYSICLGCEFYGEKRDITNDEYCKDCLCPLSKKIFSPKYDACPQHKWLDVEKKHFKSETKENKTLL